MPIAVCLVAIPGVLLLRNADAIESVYFPKCPLYILTGWHCTGCGVARALHALLHGQWAQAWAANPLLIVGLPVLASAWAYLRLRAAAGRPVAALSPYWISTIAIVLIAFGLLRNVPYYPWTLLAPH
ncbi:MAG: DUF2752 domain-containing protein [Planctomycetaceae bacterium]|nr:DUF2752 domain-containing protein [Planctomycetaceae bacterium]